MPIAKLLRSQNLATGKPGVYSLASILLFAAIIFSFTASAQKKVPELWGHRIHDEPHSLSQATVDYLEKRLQLYEDSTSNQVAILITSSLEGDILEQYTIRVAEQWQLGQKSNDNGVLLFLAVEDHAIRIEVGSGLEGVLTDALTNRIIRNEIAPRLRQDDFDGAVTAGIDAIIQAIGNEYQALDDETSTLETIVENIFYGICMLMVVALTGVALVAEGCFAWGLYIILIPLYFTLPWSVIGKNATLVLLGIFVIGFPIARIVVARHPKPKPKTKLKGPKFAGVNRPVPRVPASGDLKRSTYTAGSIVSTGVEDSSHNYNDSYNDTSSSSFSSDDDNFSGGGGSFSGGGSSGSW